MELCQVLMAIIVGGGAATRVGEMLAGISRIERIRHPLLKTPYTLATQAEDQTPPLGLTARNIRVLGSETEAGIKKEGCA